MNQSNMYIADFFKHCKTCKNEKVQENQEPCNECLSQCFNYNTDKPINWKKK